MAFAFKYDGKKNKRKTVHDQPPKNSGRNDSFGDEQQVDGAEEAEQLTEVVRKAWPLGVELYSNQSKEWPVRGKHIVASYDDSSVVVYQAFCPAIAEAAVKDQKFRGGGFSLKGVTWIKTSFLWTMDRCRWATVPNQERVLAVRITLDAFHQMLAATAASSKKEKESGASQVVIKWKLDHAPQGRQLFRYAILLGLSGYFLRKYAKNWIVSITDVTPFVHHQRRILRREGEIQVSTPLERVYVPPSQTICQDIGLNDHRPQPRVPAWCSTWKLTT